MHETAEHADLINLFNRHPELAAHFLAEHGGIRLPVGCTFQVGTAVYRSKYESDSLLLVRDPDGAVILAIVIETQRRIEPIKLESWPAYMWLVRALYHCECRVLVITTSRKVAAWARQPIHNGPGSVTQVSVLGPEAFPRISDPHEARANPALAALSAAMYAGDPDALPIQRAALIATRDLPEADVLLYCSLIFRGKNAKLVKRILEDLMQQQGQQQPRTGFRAYLALLEAETAARVEAQTAARVEAQTAARVEAHARAEILLRLLEQRGVKVTRSTRARILACQDVAQLDAWLDRVLTVRRASELFAA